MLTQICSQVKVILAELFCDNYSAENCPITIETSVVGQFNFENEIN